MPRTFLPSIERVDGGGGGGGGVCVWGGGGLPVGFQYLQITSPSASGMDSSVCCANDECRYRFFGPDEFG